MHRSQISRIAHDDHPIAAPVDRPALVRLVEQLSPPASGRVVDLGCGSGEWLLEILRQYEGLSGDGVDLRVWPSAATTAQALGLAERVHWAEQDATAWQGGPVDLVVCVGATHAWGSLPDALVALREQLLPGGQILLGDGIWERPPSAAAQDALQAGPDDYPTLAGLVDLVAEHGFEVGYGHVSTWQEWDEYEWSWTGSLVRWALSDAPGSVGERDEALAAARDHRQAWLAGYRQQLGFVTLVLTDVAAPGRR